MKNDIDEVVYAVDLVVVMEIILCPIISITGYALTSIIF